MAAPSIPPDAEVTVQSFALWLSELKARSNASLQQLLSEMSSLRDGIQGSTGEMTEFKRHSTAVQQQIGSQLTDLRDTLNSAFTEITNLVKQKGITDKELQSEINSISNQVGMKTAELEALRKSYSATHQQLKTHLITLQQSIQDTYSEVQVVKAQADRVAAATDEKYSELEMTLARVQTLYDDQKNEGDAMAESVHQELVGLSTDIATMSQEFFESKRGTKAMQQRIDGQVGQLQEAAREHDTRYQGPNRNRGLVSAPWIPAATRAFFSSSSARRLRATCPHQSRNSGWRNRISSISGRSRARRLSRKRCRTFGSILAISCTTRPPLVSTKRLLRERRARSSRTRVHLRSRLERRPAAVRETSASSTSR